MTLPRDYQFELDGYAFGAGHDVEVTSFDPSGAEVRSQDVAAAARDEVTFGRDVRSPASWGLTLKVHHVGQQERVLAALAAVGAAWDAPGVRGTPGAVSVLRYRLAGETRRVYGRPRRFSPVLTQLVVGYVPVVADFARADLLSYADVEDSVTAGLQPADMVGGGLSGPVSGNLTSAQAGAPRVEVARVGGDRPTWATVTFTGPVVDPWVTVAGWRIALAGAVGYDQQVAVSGMPWAREVRRLSDGALLPGLLDPRARLSQLLLPPGDHDVAFGGVDPTGTASATVAWRDAYASL